MSKVPQARRRALLKQSSDNLHWPFNEIWGKQARFRYTDLCFGGDQLLFCLKNVGAEPQQR
jgi:hypothetical protein